MPSVASSLFACLRRIKMALNWRGNSDPSRRLHVHDVNAPYGAVRPPGSPKTNSSDPSEWELARTEDLKIDLWYMGLYSLSPSDRREYFSIDEVLGGRCGDREKANSEAIKKRRIHLTRRRKVERIKDFLDCNSASEAARMHEETRLDVERILRIEVMGEEGAAQFDLRNAAQERLKAEAAEQRAREGRISPARAFLPELLVQEETACIKTNGDEENQHSTISEAKAPIEVLPQNPKKRKAEEMEATTSASRQRSLRERAFPLLGGRTRPKKRRKFSRELEGIENKWRNLEFGDRLKTPWPHL